MTDLSTTQTINAQGITAPQAGYKFYQPWYEDYTRRLGSSVFGTPGGIGGLMNMPQDIPLQQTAGMTPLMMQARYGLSGASPYTQAYDTSSQLMNEAAGGYRASTGGFNPYTMISPYYDPFESQVVDDTLERMRRTSAQQDLAGRAQDVSSGAFGGSRSRLLAKERQRESDRGIMQALSGIRSQGFQSSRDAAMAENARRMAAMSGAAGGLGGIAGQVLGLGGQRQQEMMNYLNMMNQYGGQGRDIYDMGLSRMYDAAMRRSQEPWDRVMKGMGVLQGMRPGELIGGYETKVMQPQTYQQPTSAGSTIEGIGGILGLGSTLADIGNTFGWWGPPKPPGKSQGGYIEKPKDYNAGGIVSGIVPVNMQDGGDAAQEMMDDLPDWVKEGMESENEFERKAAMDYISTIGAIDLDPFSDLIEGGIEKLGMSGTGLEALLLSLLAAGKARKGNPKAVQQGKTAVQSWKSLLNKRLRDEAAKRNARKAAEKEARRKTAGIGGPKGKTPLLTGPGTGAGGAGAPSIGSKAWDIIKKIGKYGGIGTVGIGGGSVLLSGLGSDDEVPEEEDRNTEKLQEKVNALEEKYAKAKNAKERKEIIDDIVKTTARLSDMMNAPGTRQVNLADAANIFAQERRNIGQEDADVERLERLSEMTGGMFSPAQLWESELTGMPPMGGIDRKDLVRNIIEYMFPEPEVGERLPEEEIRMRQMEAQLQNMTPEDLLDLIKQGYGQDPTSQSIRITAEDGLG